MEIIGILVSFVALFMSWSLWKRQFRPIISVAVEDVAGSDNAIVYNLRVLNSGSLPAKDVQIRILEEGLQSAFGDDASEDGRRRWIEAINDSNVDVLQNGASVSCSFGKTGRAGNSFWKNNAKVNLQINYLGWFGTSYKERQSIRVRSTSSFTGYSWG
jgi:hypothetical protein